VIKRRQSIGVGRGPEKLLQDNLSLVDKPIFFQAQEWTLLRYPEFKIINEYVAAGFFAVHIYNYISLHSSLCDISL